MAKLNGAETIKVLEAHSRAQSKFTGKAYDLMRSALPNDEQYKMFKRLLREEELRYRRGFAEALMDTGIGEKCDPVALARMK